MSENNVMISVKARQSFEGMESDTIELVTEGQFDRDGAGYTLRYRESEATGMEGTTTIIRVEDGRVTLLRDGPFQSQMVFEEGRRHLSLYQTPYGAMEVGVHTGHLRNGLNDAGGDLEIDYHLEVDHRLAGSNLFRIHVRPQTPGPISQ